MEREKGFLKNRKKTSLLRALKPAMRRKDGFIYFGKRRFADFSSNDYLGLSGHPAVKEAAKKAVERYGAGGSASRLLSGDLEIHHELEERIAFFKKKEAGLVFNSGYQANVGIISTLCGKKDAVFADRLSHASILDGILLSGSRLFRFNHNDAGHLETLLEKERDKFDKALIVTETVFSMDGDRPPLRKLAELKERYGCTLMVDEAHATGIFGKNGSGVVEEEGLAGRVDLIMGTFSKALGGFGAYLCSSRIIIDYLVNACRAFIYSTALPPSLVAADLAALDLIEDEPWRRARLLENADYLRNAFLKKGLSVKGSTQIVPLVIGESAQALKLSNSLKEMGYWVSAIRPPTVPQNAARLRFSLSYDHTKKTLERLVDDIGNAEHIQTRR